MIRPNLFIFGCERSGTTLLCALLSEHPQVFATNESFIFDVYARFKGYKKLSNPLVYKAFSILLPLPSGEYVVSVAEAKKYLAKLKDRYAISDRGQTQDNWLAQYLDSFNPSEIITQAETRNLTLGEIFNMIYSQIVPNEQKHKLIFGEKTPSHFYLSPWISSLYPTAKIITLVRHPITNIAAIYKRNQTLGLDYAISCYLSHFQQRFNFLYAGDKSLIIRYEDLLTNTEATLTQIYRYLNIETEQINTEFNYYIKQNYIGSKIDPQRDLKLQEFLDAKQQSLVRNRCKSVIERFYSESFK